MTCFSVRPDQNDAMAQLMSHAIQMIASNWVGQVAVHPLQATASNACGSNDMFRSYYQIASGAIPSARMSGPNPRSPGATKFLLIAGGVKEIGNGLAQRGLDRPRRVAEFALGLFN